MNTNFNLSGSGLSLSLLAAGLILAYGVWVGRRDLGTRGALGVLAASLLGLLPMLLFMVVPFVGGAGSSVRSVIGLTIISVISTALAFIPLYVAVNWLEVMGWPQKLDCFE